MRKNKSGAHPGFLLALPGLLALSLTAAWIFLPPQLSADPFDKLRRSKEMREFDKKGTKLRTASNYKQGDLDPDSNLALALDGKLKERYLMTWAEGGLIGFVRMEDFADRKPRYVINQSTFRDQQTRQVIILEIILPFPRFRMQADMGFIEAMAALQPPVLKINSSEEMRIGSRDVVLYREQSGGCSVVLKLPQGGILSASTEKCESEKRLKSFIHMLNLDRLERKLNS